MSRAGRRHFCAHIPRSRMKFLTDFADQAVVLPLVFAVAAVLAWQGWRRGAFVWLVAIGATFSVMLMLKLVLLGCASVFGAVALQSPSGHVAAASVVIGGLLGLYGRGRGTIVGVVFVVAVMVGLTRVGLHYHSWPEVVLGGCIGLTGALALARFVGAVPAIRARPLILTAVLVLALFHGRHLEAEIAIRQAAQDAGWCQGSGWH